MIVLTAVLIAVFSASETSNAYSASEIDALASQHENRFQNPSQTDDIEHFGKGHLQPFGESGPKVQVESRPEFPQPAEFFVDYVVQSKPLKLSGVARNSRAVRLWTDDYLMTLDVPTDSVVQLETKKKENRQQDREEMHFHQFLQIYNQTEHYMVDDVPTYLKPDIMVPCSLQCNELLQKGLAFALMWFSSGGTKSVIHTDAYDNINCLIRGQKTFVMVDPSKYREKIFLRTDGFYSDIDVDSVDLTMYPALGQMEFYHVNLTAGDCLYIPYKWIHQVRSYNSNIAVNFWWDHYASVDLHRSDSICQDQCDPSLTLDQVDVTSTFDLLENYENVRDWLHEVAISKNGTLDSVVDSIIEDFPSEAEEMAKLFFDKLDLNKDGQFTAEEHAKIPVETWKEIQEQALALYQRLEGMEEEEEEEEVVNRNRNEL